MAIGDRLALTLVSLPVGFLVLLGMFASSGAQTRPADALALWLAAALQAGFILTWVFLPRLPRWIVAGWGLILVAAGLGVTISGPVLLSPVAPDMLLGSATPWGLIGLGLTGLLTIIAAILHSGNPRSDV